jgi:putative ABC transport system permease protein
VPVLHLPTRLDIAVLRIAVTAYPAAFRRKFTHAIEETFGDRLAEASGSGRRGRFLVAFLVDSLVSGMRERIAPTTYAGPSSSFRKRSIMSRWLDSAFKDIRFAVRGLWRRPGFAFAAVGTLALGFGANTAIFSVVNGVLLKPLDFIQPERLVRIDVAPDDPGGSPGSMSYPDIEDIREQSPTVETLVGYNGGNFTMTGLGEPQVVQVSRVTDGLLATFQLTPFIGRDIRADEFGADAPAIVVVSNAMWRSRFGADPNILGRTVTLDAIPREIVGVAPPGFDFPGDIDFWMPRGLNIENCGRGCHTMRTIGRMVSGGTVESVQSELATIATNLDRAYPDTNTGKRFVARSLQDYVVGDVRQGLTILMAAVMLVLLIACANVANLLLASAAAREGEIAVRAALGAGRGRLMAQLFSESFVLSVTGAAVGLGLAYAGISGFRALAQQAVPRVDEIAIDGWVLLWTLGGIMVVTFLFGLVPAVTVSRAALIRGMSQTGRGGSAHKGATRLRAGLLAAEVGLSTALLIGAGLLLRTFAGLYAVDFGYETQNILRFRLNLPESQYTNIERVRTFYRSLEERIAAIPGVSAVTSMFGPPLGSGRASGTVLVEGRPTPRPEDELDSYIHPVGPGFAETLRIPVVEGRALAASDDAGPDTVAMVNEAFVRSVFPNEDPIGKRVRVTVSFGYGSPTYRIVGVVGDTRSNALQTTAPPSIFVPHGLFGPESMFVIVRTVPNVPPILPQAREQVRALDPNLPLYQIETFTDVLKEEVAPTRLYLSLVAAFAIAAALLAAVGLYGVVSYVVASRTREIGVRIALGADRTRIIGQVIGRGMIPVVVGLTFGLGLAIASGRLMQNLLYGVQPVDPLTFSGAVGLLVIVAVAALMVPAIRASRLSPATTLRFD